MPALTSTPDEHKGDVFNVLLTGFGPFKQHRPVNPSWLAVKPLHNVVIPLDLDASKGRVVKISTLEIPVSYEAVLDTVPKLHLRSPVLPEAPEDVKDSLIPLTPHKGYDCIFHVGVAGSGPLRIEKLGHKLGYYKTDVDGRLAPIVERQSEDFVDEQPIESLDDTSLPSRGFGVGYETFPDDIYTDIDVSKLVYDLKNSGIEEIKPSIDAGRYLCEFIYYCSLAESKRNGKLYEKNQNTPVLFVHCPPVGEPLTTQEVTEALLRIITWVCMELANSHDSMTSA